MANIIRRKTEMVGSLVVDADMMSQEAATPTSTKQAFQETAEAVEHFGEDIKRSVNLQKRNTEMYGTLIVDTGTVENHSSATGSGSPSPPSPGTGGGSLGRKKWSDPMDQVSYAFRGERATVWEEDLGFVRSHILLVCFSLREPTANDG
eukprot:scaffold1891_cov178-Amphora_coffeaeformis.AAC.6